MNLCKKLVAAIAVIALCLSCLLPAAAIAGTRSDVPEGYDFNVYMDFEAFTLGWGFVVPPMAVPANEGESVAAVTARALETLGLSYNYGGAIESGFYLQGVQCANTEANVPAYLMEQLNSYPAWAEENMGYSYGEWTGTYTDDGILSEMEYSGFAGWMFAVDDVSASVGADGMTVAEGQTIRWMFSIYGWGMDCGLNDGWGMFPAFDNPAEGVLRSDVIKNYVDLAADPAVAPRLEEGGSAYQAKSDFINTLCNIASSQEEIDAAYAAMLAATFDFNVYVDFEAFTLGWGFVASPVTVPAREGDSAAVITARALDMLGLNYTYGGTVASGFYLRGVQCAETVPNVPAYLMNELLAYPDWAEEEMGGGFGEWTGAYTDDGMLSEMEYSSFAGWMFAIDDVAGATGADGVTMHEGEMLRWMFSIYGWGMDCGLNDGWGMFPEFDNPVEGVLRSDVLKGYVDLASDAENAAKMAEGGEAHDEYIAFINTVGNIAASQEEIDAAYAALVSALNGVEPLVGDADCNGVTNFADVAALYNMILGGPVLNDQGIINADINGDGVITFEDVANLYAYIIGSEAAAA